MTTFFEYHNFFTSFSLLVVALLHFYSKTCPDYKTLDAIRTQFCLELKRFQLKTILKGTQMNSKKATNFKYIKQLIKLYPVHVWLQAQYIFALFDKMASCDLFSNMVSLCKLYMNDRKVSFWRHKFVSLSTCKLCMKCSMTFSRNIFLCSSKAYCYFY